MGRTAAGIVIYKPDLDVLASLVEAIAPEVGAVIVVANSPLTAQEIALLQGAAGSTAVHIDDPGDNIGLGGAYERIMARVRTGGDFSDTRNVILFDQDSSPPSGMVTALAARLGALQQAGERPAMVGPLPVAATPGHKPPTIHPHACGRHSENAQAVWFAISSGSLIDLTAFAEVGAFRDDFFIDAIDVEWCLRAWSRGFSCWVAQDIPMPHRLGAGQIRVPVIGWELPVQSPLRLSTYARNQAAMLRLPHVPLQWKMRACLYIAAQTLAYWLADHGRLARPRALAAGFAAGIAGRLGPPKSLVRSPARSGGG